MKNNLFKFILAISAAILLFSCSSVPKEQPFTVSLKSTGYPIGTIEVYLNKQNVFSNDIEKNELDVYYHPDENAICLHFKASYFINCKQFWSKEGRDAFTAAFDLYKREFEERSLKKANYKKTREAYGETSGYFTWKKNLLSVQAYGGSRVKLGYLFKDKAVFFSATQMEVDYIDPISNSRNQKSATVTIYFTQTQAESLIALFNQSYLKSLNIPSSGEGGINWEEIDEY